jgi:hypothetical protein
VPLDRGLERVENLVNQTDTGRQILGFLKEPQVTLNSILYALAAVVITYLLFKIAGSFFKFITAPIKILAIVVVTAVVFMWVTNMF